MPITFNLTYVNLKLDALIDPQQNLCINISYLKLPLFVSKIFL